MIPQNSNKTIMLVVKKTIFSYFLMQKSSRTISRSMFSKTSFSMLHKSKPFNISCNIVDLKQFFNSFNNLEELVSTNTTVTRTIKKIRYAMETFG